MAIGKGDLVHVTTATGETISMRALGAPNSGYSFPVVWVATEEEWARAQDAGSEPDGIPWPTEAVLELASTS